MALPPAVGSSEGSDRAGDEEGVVDWEVGELGGWKVGRLEGWEVGRLGGWEVGRLEGWEVGSLVGSLVGRLADWVGEGILDVGLLPISGEGEEPPGKVGMKVAEVDWQATRTSIMKKPKTVESFPVLTGCVRVV